MRIGRLQKRLESGHVGEVQTLSQHSTYKQRRQRRSRGPRLRVAQGVKCTASPKCGSPPGTTIS